MISSPAKPANAAAARRAPARWAGALAAMALLAVVPVAAQDLAREASGGAADAPAASGAAGQVFIPDLTRIVPAASSRESLTSSLQILVMMTVLAVAPSIVLMMTCFSRILIVLVLLRQALGTQTIPPSQILVGLALFMTLLVMAPTWQKLNADAVSPYLDGRLSQTEALAAAGGHLRTFMFDQIEASGNQEDVYMLYEYAAQREVPETEELTRSRVPMTALLPAFLLSELKTAFIIGFRIYLPFLVIDLVIATVLVSMGMMMLPPVLISLPFKLLLFVLADGWHLVAGALMASVSSA